MAPHKIDPVDSDFETTPASQADYEVSDQPIGTRRPLRIVCLGAGYSGLMMGIVYSQKLRDRNATLVIYERNSDLGGTWLENRYPGCKCDIPAHNYGFSFEQNPDWPNYYATSEQIFDYMKSTAQKYDLEKYIRLNHSITSATWDDELGKWKLRVRSGDVEFSDECDVFINAGGVLNNWKWPDIEGLHDFGGKLLHSASWDQTYDFTGKRVAVIGVGSSGVQIVPNISNAVKSLDMFVRSQTWISPAPGIAEPTASDPDMDSELNFTPQTLDRFRSDPEYLLAHRRSIVDRRSSSFKRAMAQSREQRDAQGQFRKTMADRLGDSPKGKRLAELLIPSFPVGCRRQTPGPGFLEALLEENVETRWDDILKITKNGILLKNGTEVEFDVIVCATGFDTSFRPAFPIIGRNGVDLAALWKDMPKAYLGITVPGFPNYFCFIGPNSPVANGSLVLSIQVTAIYIYKFLDRLQTDGIRDFEVQSEANDDYNQHIQKFLDQTVWVGNCRSWYKQGTVDGPVVAIYGGSSFHFMEVLKNPRWEDYNIRRLNKNRFAYLGNGMTIRESKNQSLGATQTLGFDSFWDLFVLPEVHS